MGVTITSSGNNLSSLDYGVAFGGGLMLNVGPGSLVFDGRYYLGLADIRKESSTSTTTKLNNVQFGIGYMFYLVGK